MTSTLFRPIVWTRNPAREYVGIELEDRRLREIRDVWWLNWSMFVPIAAMFLPYSVTVTAATIRTRMTAGLITWNLDQLGTYAVMLLFPFFPFIVIAGVLMVVTTHIARNRTSFKGPTRKRGLLGIFPIFPFMFILLLLTAATVIFVPEPPDFSPKRLFPVLSPAGMLFGGMLIAAGVMLPVDDTICCRKCGYPAPLGMLDPCPECGRDLSQPNTRRMGENRFRPVPYVAGMVLVVAAMLVALL